MKLFSFLKNKNNKNKDNSNKSKTNKGIKIDNNTILKEFKLIKSDYLNKNFNSLNFDRLKNSKLRLEISKESNNNKLTVLSDNIEIGYIAPEDKHFFFIKDTIYELRELFIGANPYITVLFKRIEEETTVDEPDEYECAYETISEFELDSAYRKNERARLNDELELEYERISVLLNYSLKDYTPLHWLVTQSYICSTFLEKKQNNNLSTNESCVIDTILFTSHMLTYICSYNITNKLKYNKFINDFKNNIAILISKDFSYDYFIINKIIENRFHLYDRLTLDEYETNVDNMISEFEYIISNDIISDKIDILSDDFPIVILGISEKMSIRSDIVAYYSSFSDLFSKVIKDVVKFYS